MRKFSDEVRVEKENAWQERAGALGIKAVRVSYGGSEAVRCERCGDRVHPSNYHYHINAPICTADSAAIDARLEGYIYETGISNAARARWAEPFCKQFPTAIVDRKVEKRWWAMEWWWDIYRKSWTIKDDTARIETLEQIYKAYLEKDQTRLDAIVAGVLMAADYGS
jgi:hypothetical protein